MRKKRFIHKEILSVVSILIAVFLITLLPLNTIASDIVKNVDSVDSVSVAFLDPPKDVTIPFNTSVDISFNATVTAVISMQLRTVSVYLTIINQNQGINIECVPREFTFSGSGTHEESFRVEIHFFELNESDFFEKIHVEIGGSYQENPGLFYYEFGSTTQEIPLFADVLENETIEQSGSDSSGLLSSIPLPVLVLFPLIIIAVIAVIVVFWYFKKRKNNFTGLLEGIMS